ncbi:MAG: 50S ribosomal protein L7/L12 [Clostridia bacterium]|nr:50S ribosomal protein L7/L12 [Clostridia bacterium]
MADLKSFVEEIKKLSVMEVSELVKMLEEEFGVSAAAPVAVMGAAGAPAAAAEEKSEFTVVLKDAGANKIAVIKIVKELTGLGLGEAKALVDGAPKNLKENVPAEEAKEIEAKLKEAGATVELK